jgi:cation/acetate symporter
MTAVHSSRVANPRIAIYYGIVVSFLIALLMMALMLEQLGTAPRVLGHAAFGIPLALYLVIALRTIAADRSDFFASGRRVTALINGLVAGVVAVGGIGLASVTGAFVHIGADALALTVGILAGLVLLAVLIAPFLRKAGDYTIAGFLGRRFESGAVRILAAVVAFVPAALIAGAELKIAALAAGWLVDVPPLTIMILVAASAAFVAVLGGLRALTWSGAAQAIVALLALAIPATLVALALTNLPLPQMSQGNVLRQLAKLEQARGVPMVISSLWVFDLPDGGLQPLTRHYLQMYGSMSGLTFALTMLTVMAGIAASPALIARTGTTHSVFAVRKSLAWAVVTAGFIVLTLSACAIFLRFQIVDQIVGTTPENLPQWFRTLQALGIVRLEGPARIIALGNISIQRDAALVALPIAAGLPASIIYLSVAGVLAAALAAAASGIAALGAILAQDVVRGEDGAPSTLGIARGAVVVAALLGLAIAVLKGDPLQMAMWAFAMASASLFPVLVLSIWWKRMNKWGAMAGLAIGFGSAATLVAISALKQLDAGSVIAGPLCGLAAAAASIVVSQLTHPAGRHVLEMVRDLRIPGGETLYDRQVRLARLKTRKAT